MKRPMFFSAIVLIIAIAIAIIGITPMFSNAEIVKYAVDPKYNNAGGFSEGLAPVKIGSKWGYIDVTGKYVTELQFDDAGSFNEGLAPVKVGDKWGYIENPLK